MYFDELGNLLFSTITQLLSLFKHGAILADTKQRPCKIPQRLHFPFTYLRKTFPAYI